MSSGADGSDPSTGLGPGTIPELPDREPPLLQAPSPAPQQEAVVPQTEAPVPVVTIVISRPGEEVQTPDAKVGSPACSPQAGDGKATATSASLTASAAELGRSDSFDDYEQCRAAKEEVKGSGGLPVSSGTDGSDPSMGLDPGMIPEPPDCEPPLLQAPLPAPQQEVVASQAKALVPAVTIVISRPGVEVQMPDAKGGSPACSPQASDGKATATSVSLTASAAVKEAELARSDSFDDYEQCRVCQQKTEEPLVDLGCRCRGDLAKAHRTCIDVWFRTRGSNKCEICQQVAVNIPPPETQASGWFSPLWVAFAILIGGLLLDVLISVSLGVSALPVNIIIGVLIVLGLGTALRLALECCQEWGSRRNASNMPRLENIPPTGYHPAVV
ncbi:uncharacterized protein LOC8070472 isoform X2 [Sorghum bicolor]|uniref:uncharacterized protein LOC8070472 isoform X2 n=1 Tax=Sorghum bicolor TaxID=4558 RepID=UPI000B4238B3|nr:uncharacterized protein LOC8070472 isoform X2 [Sorghum bicolor]|eukprot:XP_021307058.1 uncharacterized protein LOC8070472 isoform X2 [Sorghum bicolor]